MEALVIMRILRTINELITCFSVNRHQLFEVILTGELPISFMVSEFAEDFTILVTLDPQTDTLQTYWNIAEQTPML